MDALNYSSWESDQKQVLNSNGFEPTKMCTNISHTAKVFEVLQTLRKDNILCDVKLETENGTIVFGHKVILGSASPYFRAMFSSYDERNNDDLVSIKELDSTASKLLVDYIYSSKIMITDENVQVLLPAAKILQLDYVSDACAEFLQIQLAISNCLGIKAFAELHNCTELMINADAFIKKHFLEVVKGDEFLNLSSQELAKLISYNDLNVPFEEKVFECVVKWVKHDLGCRKDNLPELMEHVRLPLLASTPDILKTVLDEPLLQNSPNYKDYVFEVFQFNLLKSVQHFTIPLVIRSKPRKAGGLQKVILIFNLSDTLPKCYTEWYDSATKIRKKAPEMNDSRITAGLGVIRDQFVFVVGGMNNSSSQTVNIVDLYSRSPRWVPMENMLVGRRSLGVGVLYDTIYAVGGNDGTRALNSIEVFDVSSQKWKILSSMSTHRSNLGVGVLNNCVYAVGGFDGNIILNSVECYDPILDRWASVQNMSIGRVGVGVGVLDGVLYAIGGYNGRRCLKSAEAYSPSVGVWSPIADMHLGRRCAGVVTFDGLLYVMGGNDGSSYLDSIEIYNPKTNTWVMELFLRNGIHIYGGVVVDKPSHFTTDLHTWSPGCMF